jgi:cell division protein FtsB
MDSQQQLFGYMAVANDQQKAIQTAIDTLTAEREALAQERARLAQTVQSISKAVRTAVGAAVKDQMGDAGETAATALETALNPILENFSGVIENTTEAGKAISQASAWFSWKWVILFAAGFFGVCLMAYISLAWQFHEVQDLRQQKATLSAEIPRMQATVAELAKHGGNVVWNHCGGRLCFEVSSNQGTYSNGSPLPLGAWTTDHGKIELVIPKGY